MIVRILLLPMPYWVEMISERVFLPRKLLDDYLHGGLMTDFGTTKFSDTIELRTVDRATIAKIKFFRKGHSRLCPPHWSVKDII